MNLFDENSVDPSNTRPKDHLEPDFLYLQTSARPMIAKIRDLLEEWFTLYPDEHKADLRQRFRAKNGVESPLFELTLYNIFLKMKAEIQIHPHIDGTENKPDFHVRLINGFEFYLEAVVTRGMSDKELGREQMVKGIYSVIDKRLRSPNFFFSIDILELGEKSPNSKKLVNDLFQYMSEVDLEEAIKTYNEYGYQSYEEKYRFLWQYEDWQIELIPIPKQIEAVGKPSHRPLGAYIGHAKWSTTKQDIRSSVEFKVGHHNLLKKPYIVAVNSIHWITDETDFIDALYGSEVVHIGRNGASSFSRDRDGVWIDKDGLRNGQLIAVIGVPILTPTTLDTRHLVVYRNPYIDCSDEALFDPINAVFPGQGNTLERRPGPSLGEIFGFTMGEHTARLSEF